MRARVAESGTSASPRSRIDRRLPVVRTVSRRPVRFANRFLCFFASAQETGAVTRGDRRARHVPTTLAILDPKGTRLSAFDLGTK
jgi:hypothetical protein